MFVADKLVQDLDKNLTTDLPCGLFPVRTKSKENKKILKTKKKKDFKSKNKKEL